MIDDQYDIWVYYKLLNHILSNVQSNFAFLDINSGNFTIIATVRNLQVFC